MTWTPIAERYLYVSIAFFVPMVALFLAGIDKQRSSIFLHRSQYVLMIILVGFFSTTLHRAWIWQDNERLYADTVKKSPNFLPAKSELASALIRKGKRAQAESILVAMQSKSSSNSFLNDDMNLPQSLMAKGELEKARNLLLGSLEQPGKKYHEILQILLKINSKRLGRIENSEERQQVQQESLKWLLEQQRVKPNPFTLYRIGKMQLSCGDKDAALEYFKRAYAGSPSDSHYRVAAGRFIQQLQ
jgi:tetratricopeptide (TPR) repeat protein